MSLREWMNSNAGPALIGAGVLLAFGLGLILWHGVGSGTGVLGDQAYYHDPTSDAFFVADRQALPPITTPAGGEDGLRAHIYSCGECPPDIEGVSMRELEETGAFVNHLERYTIEAKSALEDEASLSPGEADVLRVQGRELQPAGDAQWVPGESPTAMAIEEAADERCEHVAGTAARQCLP